MTLDRHESSTSSGKAPAQGRQLVARASQARDKLSLAWRDGGAKGTVAEFSRLAGRAFGVAASVVADVAFDVTSGVRTRGVLHPSEDLRAGAAGGDPKSYGTTPLIWWRQMRSALPIDPSTATFIDLGAGRGRILILAAKMGFKKVIGVELDPALAREAEENVARWLEGGRRRARKGHDIDVVVQDAATFAFPPGPMVVGLFNPFGATTMEQVLRGLCRDRRPLEEEVYVAYFYPRHADVFEQFPELVRHSSGHQWVLYRLQVTPSEITGETGAAAR